MPRLKVLSGREVVRILEGFGFQVHSQRGSHIKMRRLAAGGFKESLTIPDHHEIDLGTLRAIFVQSSRFVAVDLLRKEFCTD